MGRQPARPFALPQSSPPGTVAMASLQERCPSPLARAANSVAKAVSRMQHLTHHCKTTPSGLGWFGVEIPPWSSALGLTLRTYQYLV